MSPIHPTNSTPSASHRSPITDRAPLRRALPLLVAIFLPLFAAAQAPPPTAPPPPTENEGVVGNTVWESIEKGGAVMYVILGASILGIAFAFEATFRTRRARLLPTRFGRDLESDEVSPEAFVAEGPDCAMKEILAAGLRWRGGTSEQRTEAIEEIVDEWLWRLRRAARPVGIIANTAPLLGLLGTVIGIIQAFDAVARQGALGDPGALAGGISKALLTTCFGLIVAIPMLLVYHWLTGRIEIRLRHCEQVAKDKLILPPPTSGTPSEAPDAVEPNRSAGIPTRNPSAQDSVEPSAKQS